MMRRLEVFVHGMRAGLLEEFAANHYRFTYDGTYDAPPVSLTMPLTHRVYEWDRFPPFFEGLLPEGVMLDGLLRNAKLDKKDFIGQLNSVGDDLVGSVTVKG